LTYIKKLKKQDRKILFVPETQEKSNYFRNYPNVVSRNKPDGQSKAVTGGRESKSVSTKQTA
jgi:predicted glycosyltransferase